MSGTATKISQTNPEISQGQSRNARSDDDPAKSVSSTPNMRPPRETPYLNYVSELSRHMPHLRTILGRYRHQALGRVHVIGPRVGFIPRDGIKYEDDSHNTMLTTLRSIWRESSAGTAFIVEDLCPSIVEIIGDIFHNPHPEIFAEHLHRSGHRLGRVSGGSSDEWNTAGFRKPFASISWFRPCLRHDQEHGVDATQSLQYTLMEEEEEYIESLDDRDDISESSAHQLPRFRRYVGRQAPRKKQQKPAPKVIITTNILRAGVSLEIESSDMTSARSPFLWGEKATVLLPDDKYDGKVLILLDPLPLVQRKEEDAKLPYTTIRSHRHPSLSLPDIDTLESGILSSWKETSSTAYDLSKTLQLSDNGSDIHQVADPIKSLLNIVYQDVGDSFELIEVCLERLGDLSMNDYELQTNLDRWRVQLASFQEEATRVLDGLQRFAATLYGPDLPDDVHRLHERIQNKATILLKKIALCQSGLRADMSLLESRRGIAEAESVTRLTELAFIFIPLSFVSSLFSMQVNELATGVPASRFVAAGFIVLFIIYGLRLAIRARSAVRLRRYVVDEARRYNELAPSEPIPTIGFLFFCAKAMTTGIVAMTRLLTRFCLKPIFWGGGWMWGIWFSLTAVALTAVPVTWLWVQSGFDTSFKAVGTLIFVPTGPILAWTAASLVQDDAGWSSISLWDRTSGVVQRHYRRPGHSASSGEV